MKVQFLLPICSAIMAVLIFSMTSLVSKPKLEGDVVAGKKIFISSSCTTCHRLSGKPAIPGVPNFSKGERMEKTDAQLIYSIKTGVAKPAKAGAPPMPAYGGGPQLTDTQLADLVAFVRSLKK